MSERSKDQHPLVPSLPRAFAALLVAAWAWTAWQLVSLPEPELVTNLLVDDAFYFALPARHLVEGRGFSFDGLEPSNGVQALWALVAIAAAAVCPDPTSMLRAMLAVGALCWGLAALGVYRWLRPHSRLGALVAAVGLAWSGVHGRLAFQGMENALQALLTVLVLHAGSRAVARRFDPASTWLLGLAMALFALGRTEAAMLGPIMAVAVLVGWPCTRELSMRDRLKVVLRLAVPGVLSVGGLAVFSRAVFDCWLPVSGRVKSFYEGEWGRGSVHGGPLATAAWHVRFVWNLAIAPLREGIPALLADVVGLRVRVVRTFVWLALVAAVVAAVRAHWSRGGALRASRFEGGSFLWVLAAFAVLHLLTMGLLLPHFTGYGTWYFASECVVVWIVVGVVVASGAGRSRGIAAGVGCLLASMAAGGALAGTKLAHDVRTNAFREAGIWLAEHADPGARIGAMSAGLVGWYARGRHVVNLDGLINTRAFLDDVLRPSRMEPYFEEKGIRWVSDYQPRAAWRQGLGWRGLVPAKRLVPRGYARLGATDAHVTWQVLPRGAAFELLGDGVPPVRDRYAELAVAADVHGRFPVVPAPDLAGHLTQSAGHVVARTIVELPSLELHHVVTPREELDTIALTAATVHPEQAAAVDLGLGLSVLGVDAAVSRQHARDRVAVTLFWQVDAPQADRELWLLVLDPVGRERDRVAVARCHGTLAAPHWPVGRVVPETVVLSPGLPSPWRLELEQRGPQPRRHPLPMVTR